MKNNNHSNRYKKNSLSLLGTVSMGTGVMIGAGIFALTGKAWLPERLAHTRYNFLMSQRIAG